LLNALAWKPLNRSSAQLTFVLFIYWTAACSWVQNMSRAEQPVAPFPKNMDGCVYEEDVFTNFTVKHIMGHNTSDGPLLAFHAAHSIHTPLEVRSRR